MVYSVLPAVGQRGREIDDRGLSGDAIEDPEVGLAVRELRATSIVEAIELLAVEGSGVVAVDVMVVGIVVPSVVVAP